MTDDPVAPLLARVAAEDRAAFRDLYRTTAPKLMGVLLRILGDRGDAEDALQELFTRVWLRAGRFDPSRGQGISWMIALARNLAIDRIRARRETATDDEAMAAVPDTAPRAETRLVAQGEARRITDCLGTLEAAQAEAVRGAYLGGLSYLELAARHGVPLNTLRTWLRRGLLKLKDCLER